MIPIPAGHCSCVNDSFFSEAAGMHRQQARCSCTSWYDNYASTMAQIWLVMPVHATAACEVYLKQCIVHLPWVTMYRRCRSGTGIDKHHSRPLPRLIFLPSIRLYLLIQAMEVSLTAMVWFIPPAISQALYGYEHYGQASSVLNLYCVYCIGSVLAVTQAE